MEAEIFFGRRVTCRKKHSSGSLGKFRKKKKSKSEPKSQNRDAEERDIEQGYPMCTRKNVHDPAWERSWGALGGAFLSLGGRMGCPSKIGTGRGNHLWIPVAAISSIQFRRFIFYIAFPFCVPKENFVRCYPWFWLCLGELREVGWWVRRCGADGESQNLVKLVS